MGEGGDDRAVDPARHRHHDPLGPGIAPKLKIHHLLHGRPHTPFGWVMQKMRFDETGGDGRPSKKGEEFTTFTVFSYPTNMQGT